MCGINGFTWKDEALARRMDVAIKHRGPDATDIYLGEGVTLGHNRLAIIDLSPEAGQPMKSQSGRYHIVFNGEIYNFAELKKELTGYDFKTHGDTEVILAAYERWGRECVSRMNGIFAFAIWDSQARELFLARDHNGIKPLYYALRPGPDGRQGLIFSSEIKAILECGMPRKLRRDSLSDYLRVLYVPEPFTMFEGVMKLPQASYAVWKDGHLNITKYWGAETPGDFRASRDDLEAELRKVMASAVKRQLVSDVPLGIFLSGGMDSTVLLHHMAETHDKISTYSVGFELTANEQEEKFNQDFNLARRTAEHYGTDHHEARLSVDDVVGTLEDAVWHLDEPIANPTMIAQYILSSFAKKTVTVVLGGDELFGGYDRYRFSLLATRYRQLPGFVRGIADSFGRLRKLDMPAGAGRYAQFLFQKDGAVGKVAPNFRDKTTLEYFDRTYFKDPISTDFERAFMDTDRQSWLVDESLMRTDKMTMSAAIEYRVPFLDKDVIAFAGRVPTRDKVSLKRTKILVRDAYARHIPDFIYNQPKRGWFSPGAKWLRNPKIYALAHEVLAADYCAATKGLFDWQAVVAMLEDHKDAKRYNSVMLWALIIFQIWARKYEVRTA